MTNLKPIGILSLNELRFVLESAIHAPSADNRLPIRFLLAEDAIEIHASEALPLPGGYRELLLLLTLGAVAENAVIAASRTNVRLEVDASSLLRPEEALLRLIPANRSVNADPLLEQLKRRHTNRRALFRGQPLSHAMRQEISTTVGAAPGCEIHWLTPESRSFMIGEMTRAEAERMRNPTLHRELFSAIRFDVGWKASCLEGLPPGALQVEGFARPFFSMLRHWNVARPMNRLGAATIFGLRSCYFPCRLAPDLAAITVDRLDPVMCLFAGRAFQRAWLALTGLNRALQPFPAAALYAMPESPKEGVPESLRNRLITAWRREFGRNHPVLFFRTGTARPPRVFTGRLPVERYLQIR